MAVFEAIATTYLTGTAASVEFTSIPATYEHLQVRISGRQNISGSAGGSLRLQFNGDTGSNYSNHTIQTYSGTSLNSDGYASFAYVYQGGRLTGPTVDAEFYATTILDIADYANTNKNTTFIGLTQSIPGGSGYLSFYSALWDDTAAVTSILLYSASDDLVEDTTMTLYGLNSAN